MKNKLLYICILAIFSVGFFFLGWFIHKTTLISTSIDISGIEEAETARLTNIDGLELKIITNTYFFSRNFIFLDDKTGEIVTTLSVENPAREWPYYRIVKGYTRDWLVVTRILRWGTGMQDNYDEWYILGRSGKMEMALSYSSESYVLDYDGKNLYWSTDIINESYPDDSAVDIKVIEKSCSITEDGSDKDCSESSSIVHYVWDSDREEFVFGNK